VDDYDATRFSAPAAWSPLALEPFSSGAQSEESEVAKKSKKFLSRRQLLLDKIELSYPTILKLMRDPVNPFPAPIMIGSRPFWDEDEVDKYMANKPRRPPRGDAA
jgi:predicted DNA-binding transcriptional regulator AlpA